MSGSGIFRINQGGTADLPSLVWDGIFFNEVFRSEKQEMKEDALRLPVSNRPGDTAAGHPLLTTNK